MHFFTWCQKFGNVLTCALTEFKCKGTWFSRQNIWDNWVGVSSKLWPSFPIYRYTYGWDVNPVEFVNITWNHYTKDINNRLCRSYYISYITTKQELYYSKTRHIASPPPFIIEMANLSLNLNQIFQFKRKIYRCSQIMHTHVCIIACMYFLAKTY